nr:Glyco_hydro_20 [uncultured Bacteroides sp.]
MNDKGRNIIGWDEILEGGLAPNATVMSWRGIEGGINAAKAGHDAIMTPGAYVYLDHYQEDPEIAPTQLEDTTR